MIISIVSQKGGVGKSTISINLALGFAGLPGKPSVALCDGDEQQSCVETLQGQSKDKLMVIPCLDKAHRIIEGLKQQVIFCDTPPIGHDIAYQCAACSDLVLIPLQPSPLDVRSLARTVKALLIIQEKFNPGLQCRFLINRLAPRTMLGHEIRETLGNLYPVFPVLESVLCDRQAYKQSLISGQSVIEFDKSSPAAQELGQLLKEVVKITKIKVK